MKALSDTVLLFGLFVLSEVHSFQGLTLIAVYSLKLSGKVEWAKQANNLINMRTLCLWK